jgi:predicted GNAT family acetyltransferase
MAPPVTFHLTSDPQEAHAWFGPLIERDPESLSVIASVTELLVRDPGRYEGPRWWAGHDGAHVVAAFMHTPPHALHVGLATADQAAALATALAAQGDALPGVGGVREPAQAFAAEWAARTGARTHVTMEIGRFDLPVRPQVPFDVEGAYRHATEDDVALVDVWRQEFADVIEGPGRRVPSAALAVAAGRVGLWVVDHEPVSMAIATTASGGVARIGAVWTPPELRRHGYASAVVAALSAERLDAGEACMLFTDLDNPTSNAIYRAMGYRRVGDAVSIAFDA